MHRQRILIGLTLVASAVWNPSTSYGQVTEDSLVLAQLETTWNEAHIRGDPEALDLLWDEDLRVFVPGMEPLTKPQVLGVARSGRMRFRRYETTDLQIRTYGDAAVVTGRLHRARQMNDEIIEDEWQFTKVYIRRAAGWRVVAFHASTAPRL